MKRLTFILALLMCFASCQRIELHIPTSSIYVKFNTERNPGAEDCRLRYSIVKICLYDIETHQLRHEDFISMNGGFLNIKPGVYDAIFHTFGSEVTIVGNTSTRASTNAYTGSGGRERSINSPDHIFVGRAENLDISIYSEAEEVRVLNVDMKTIVETYTLEFTNVEGIENISSAKIYIPGQVPCKYLWDERKPNSECSVAKDLELDTENSRIHAEFNTFGRYTGAPSKVNAELEIRGKDGMLYNFTCDITDQFDNPDNTDNKITVTDTVVIPEGGSGDAGFTPEVKDWEDEVTHVPLQ